MNLSRRLDNLEGNKRASALHTLREIGMGEDRIGDVLSPRGIEWEKLTDDELRQIAGPDDGPIYPGGPPTGDLTDDQLQRIADGEPPRKVVG